MNYLIDLNVLLAYSFELHNEHESADRFFTLAENEEWSIHLSSIAILEAETLFLSGKVNVEREEWLNFIHDILTSPVLRIIEISPKIFLYHTFYYRGYGGKYSYFDSFHVATARETSLPLATLDNKILAEKTIKAVNLRDFKRVKST